MTSSMIYLTNRKPFDRLIDQFTQSVERSELAAGIVHERDREQLKTIAGCECLRCLEDKVGGCAEDPERLAEDANGEWKVVCGWCHDRHYGGGPSYKLDGMTDADLAEWGRVR